MVEVDDINGDNSTMWQKLLRNRLNVSHLRIVIAKTMSVVSQTVKNEAVVIVIAKTMIVGQNVKNEAALLLIRLKKVKKAVPFMAFFKTSL